MAIKILYTSPPEELATLIYSSVTVKSAPRTVLGAEPKFSATFGVGEQTFKACVKHMVEAIKSEMGDFTKPEDYYLACMSGVTAGKRALAKAELDARGKSADDAFKIMEKAQKRAELYKPFAGILTCSSKFDVELCYVKNGKVIDIPRTELALAQAGKDMFYPGAKVGFGVEFQAFKRKSMDAKDGCTAYFQRICFVQKGPNLGIGGGPANSEVFGGFSGYSDVDPTALAPEPEAVGGHDF